MAFQHAVVETLESRKLGIVTFDQGKRSTFYLSDGKQFARFGSPGNSIQLAGRTPLRMPAVGVSLLCQLSSTGAVIGWGLCSDYYSLLLPLPSLAPC